MKDAAFEGVTETDLAKTAHLSDDELAAMIVAAVRLLERRTRGDQRFTTAKAVFTAFRENDPDVRECLEDFRTMRAGVIEQRAAKAKTIHAPR